MPWKPRRVVPQAKDQAARCEKSGVRGIAAHVRVSKRRILIRFETLADHIYENSSTFERKHNCSTMCGTRMDPLSISAASGMKARMEALDMLANNIANASTAGFKLDRENYNIFTAQDLEVEDGTQSPVSEKNWTD